MFDILFFGLDNYGYQGAVITCSGSFNADQLNTLMDDASVRPVLYSIKDNLLTIECESVTCTQCRHILKDCRCP